MMSLFSKLFGGTKIEAPTLELPKNHLAFILLEQPALPSEEALVQAFSKYSQGNHTLTISKDDSDRASDADTETVLSVTIEGVGYAFLGLMPTPVPNGEAESAFQFSVSSYSEGSELGSHSAHLMVTLILSEDVDPMDAIMAYTSLVAAATETTKSIGVYWGNAGATHTRDFFLSIAEDHTVNPRILLWNGISRAGEPGNKASYLSYGMNQLALPDLYLICDAEEAGAYFSRFFDLLSYVADRGEAIPAGDTIGATEDEKIVIKYVKSPADSSQIVWKVVH